MDKPKFALSELQQKACQIAQKVGKDKPNYTDEAYERIQKLVGAEENQIVRKTVNLALKPQEKMAVYYDVLERLRANTNPEAIARSVVVCISEILDEKQKEMCGASGVKGPVFRRSED